jgi:DNA-binding IclR family transcriptional regulator
VAAVTDPDDFFGLHEEAEAVTDGQTDSVETPAEQTEADALRADTDTIANSTIATKPRRRTVDLRCVARCRFGRCPLE